jgi:hypothetical protein
MSSLQELHNLGLFHNTKKIPKQKPNTIKLEKKKTQGESNSEKTNKVG